MRHRASKMRSLALILVATLLIPLVYSVQAPRVNAWGSTTHQFITSNAIDVFSDGSFFSEYSSTIVDWSIVPDTVFKSADPNEGPRHYYDYDISSGMLPWAAEDNFNRLVALFEGGDWQGAAELAGVLSHYVEDASNPLHGTSDYNPLGSMHSEYEGEVNNRVSGITIPEYVPHEVGNIFDLMMQTLLESYEYAGDTGASYQEDDLNYWLHQGVSWNDTIESITENRIHMDIQLLANIWYTAMTRANLVIAAPTLALPGNGAITSDNTPTFDWSSTVTDYQLEYATDNEFTTNVTIARDLTTTSYTPTTPLADGTWYWHVRSGDNATSVGLWSDTWQFTVNPSLASPPPLISPSNGSFINDAAPTFKWSVITGADNYELHYATEDGFTANLTIIDNIRENQHTPTTALADNTWYWRVRAGTDADVLGPWSEIWSFAVDTIAPPAPSLVSPADTSILSVNTLTFGWTEVSDPSDVTYTLQLDDKNTFSEPLVFENAGTSDNTYTLPDENALADGTYYWRVRSVDGVGNENMSEVWRFTVDTDAPAVPTLLAPENSATVTTIIPTFDWSDVSDPSGVTYWMQVDASPADWVSCAIDVSDLTSSSYTPTTGLADGSYEWRILAVDGVGNASDWSSTWLLTVARSSTTLTIDLVSFTIQPENSITIIAVLTSKDAPLAGKRITWTTTAGSVSPESGTTDAQGKVSATYTAPDIETPVTVTASFAEDENYLGSSGNSSGTIKTASLELTLAVKFIPAGENHAFKFEDYPVPVFKVTITVEDNVEDAGVTVEMLENVEVPVPRGMVHRYMKIESNIAPANIRGLVTRFSVSKSWVVQNDIDEETIRVLKFDEVENEWRELTTEPVGSDENYLYFETEAQSLSLFAITGEKVPMPILLYLAVVASAGGAGAAAALWVRSKRRPSRLGRARRVPKRRKKGKKHAT